MKRIAFISTMFGSAWGGSEELWSRTALRLLQEGHTVAANVESRTQPVAQLQELIQAGCEIKYRHIRYRLEMLTRGLITNRRHAWIDAVKPDLVVISQGHFTEGVDWMQHCTRLGIPYAILVQAVGEQKWPPAHEALALADGFEKAIRTYFLSQGNIDSVRSQLGTPLHNTKIVRNPFNVSYEAAPPWLASEGVIKLACVGRLHPASKGQDLLLSVLGTEKWRQRPVTVDFFGEGEDKVILEALARMYNVENIAFRGTTADIEGIWAAHHALILPSRYEGLPLVVVEAMLCGRPCIVTDVAGNAELMTDDVSGFVAGAPTVKHLAEAMERAWQKRDEWKRMGAAAARQVRSLVPSDPVSAFVDELKSLL